MGAQRQTKRNKKMNNQENNIQQCLDLQLQGYKTETEVPDELLEKLPLEIPYAGINYSI